MKMSNNEFRWPKIAEFDVHRTLKCVYDYIETFNYKPDLKYYVDFLKQYVNDECMRLVYEVKWSTPSKKQPIPEVTASMYFTFRYPFDAPLESQVEVTYAYECLNTIFKPGQNPFNENWIRKLMKHKEDFIRMQESAFGVVEVEDF